MRSFFGTVAFALLFPALIAAAPSPQQIFDRVREQVALQLKKSANYTCVQTIDRDYFSARGKRGCDSLKQDDGTPSMHDRLRLDVAVASGEEIFSWHGSKSFSTKGISDVVQLGPISSGSFVGYLQQIFFRPGIHIRYKIAGTVDRLFHFEYDVPLSASRHSISNGISGAFTPFHGEFAADTETYELVTLSAVIDRPPKRSRICFAKSEIEYKTMPISGAPSRLVSGFKLETKDENGFVTRSANTYQACRAFTGESTISFGDPDAAAGTNEQTMQEALLPAGLRLSIAVRTPVDNLRSYTGDPVEGSLSRPVKIPKTGITLQRGALVNGTITRLETHYEPGRYYVLKIRFDTLVSGGSIYSLQAIPADSQETGLLLRSLFGAAPPQNIKADLSHGVLLGIGSHFHLNERIPIDWVTIPLPPDQKH